ncbi:MAG: HEAT repeat domain-containing protein, partial [Limisphaerales bacterium]
HDLHGLAFGPDEKIYFSSGDRGFSVKTQEGKLLDYPDTGGVLRCNPDGSELEVFCTGLRNPQGLVFDAYGNLFTDDNDTAGADDSRWLYLVEGGDYGWRCSYQHMSGYGPWVLENAWLGHLDGMLPYSGTVAQGPAGIAFYPGTGLSEKYLNHFFACDFPKGVWSFTLKPKGASYELAQKEKFLWNLGPTHVEFGPDSNLYISDWGTTYPMPNKGRIYKVFNPSATNNSAASEVKEFLSEGLGKKSVDELAQLLGHSDRRVRLEAQFELATRRSAARSFQNEIKTPQNQLARIHAMWGLLQLSRSDQTMSPTNEIISWRSVVALLDDSDEEVRAQAAKVLGDGKCYEARNKLIKSLEDTAPRVQFFAAQSLGKLKSKEAIAPLLQMLQRNADQDSYLVHAGILALVKIGDLAAIQKAAQDKNISRRRAALLCLRRMANPEIAQFLFDAEPKLILEAARAINDVPINSAMPALAAKVGQAYRLVRAGGTPLLLSRAINANFRLGQNSNAVVLANFAADTTAPEAMRAEALDALSDWANPSQLDRVMGLWRPLPKREISVAQNAVHSVTNELFKTNSAKVLFAAIRCARKLELKEISPALFKIFQNAKSATGVRIEALQTLAAFKDQRLSSAVALALSDENNDVRREGIKWIEQIDEKEAAPFLEKLLRTEEDLKLNQTIFATLGHLKNSSADKIIIGQLELMLAAKIRPELQLDLLEAAEKRNSPQLKAKLKQYETTLSPKDELAKYRVALSGGDAALGQKIFNEREDVACLRCHAIKGRGGTVGPDLAGIARRHPREYLLESLLWPNKQIAPGFENVAVILENGNSYAGTVKSETAMELVLNSPEEGILKLNKKDTLKRERNLSPMPEGLDKIISKRDLRNLMEFLSTLK